MQPAPAHQDELYARFKQFFTMHYAADEQSKEAVYRIRYDVYCDEFRYPLNHQDHKEQDSFDYYSQHCLLTHNRTESNAGCVRLITPAERDHLPLPFELHCGQYLDRSVIDPARLPPASYCEISRLAVPAHFRKRKDEKLTPTGVIGDIVGSSEVEKRNFPFIAISLYMAAMALFLERRMAVAFVATEPRLIRHLSRFGIHFKQASEVVDYYGKRAVYFAEKESVMNDLAELESEYLHLYHYVNQSLKRKNRL